VVGKPDESPVGGAQMPSSVRLRDVSLRGIENLPSLVLTHEKRQELLCALAAAGVNESVSGSVHGRDLTDLRADVESVKILNPGIRLTCPLVYTVAAVERVGAAGFVTVQVWVPPWGRRLSATKTSTGPAGMVRTGASSACHVAGTSCWRGRALSPNAPASSA
jgi:hypothetical protein